MNNNKCDVNNVFSSPHNTMRCDNRCNAMLNAIYKCKMGIHALYINTTNITTASNKMATLFVRHNIYALLPFVHTYLWEKNLLLASVHTYPASSWECISLCLPCEKYHSRYSQQMFFRQFNVNKYKIPHYRLVVILQ